MENDMLELKKSISFLMDIVKSQQKRIKKLEVFNTLIADSIINKSCDSLKTCDNCINQYLLDVQYPCLICVECDKWEAEK
jgi:hypothetical protein